MRNGEQIRVVIHLENKYYLSQVRIDTNILRDRVGFSTLAKITADHREIMGKIKFFPEMNEGVIGTVNMEFIRGMDTHHVPVDVLSTEHGDFGIIMGSQTSSFFGFQTTQPAYVVDVSSTSSEGEEVEESEEPSLVLATIFYARHCMLS